MENTTLLNINNSKNIANNSKLTKVVHHAIDLFCNNLGFTKGYFSKYLPYSETQSLKYMNPNNNDKHFKITDLEIILNNLDKEHKKIILDSLCHTHGFICVDSANSSNNSLNVESLLLKISASNGNLADNFLIALQDGKLTSDEKQSLAHIAYCFRSLLIEFENKLKES